MSSRIEALCVLVLCLCGIFCSSVGVEDRVVARGGSVVVVRIPGIGVDYEVRAVPSRRADSGSDLHHDAF